MKYVFSIALVIAGTTEMESTMGSSWRFIGIAMMLGAVAVFVTTYVPIAGAIREAYNNRTPVSINDE